MIFKRHQAELNRQRADYDNRLADKDRFIEFLKLQLNRAQLRIDKLEQLMEPKQKLPKPADEQKEASFGNWNEYLRGYMAEQEAEAKGAVRQ